MRKEREKIIALKIRKKKKIPHCNVARCSEVITLEAGNFEIFDQPTTCY